MGLELNAARVGAAKRSAMRVLDKIEPMNFTIEVEPENDGRWIAEVPDLPGVVAYGSTRERAVANAEALALRVVAERLENEEDVPDMTNVFLVAA